MASIILLELVDENRFSAPHMAHCTVRGVHCCLCLPAAACVRGGHCARRTFVRGGHRSRRTLSAAYIVRMTSCGGHSPRRTFSGAVRGGLSANPRRIRQSPRRIRSDPRGLADSAAESAADFFVRLGHRPRRTVGRTYADIRGHRRIRLSTRRIRGGQSPPHIVPNFSSDLVGISREISKHGHDVDFCF